MTVTCDSLDDFITNLRVEGPDAVFKHNVYVCTTKSPAGSDGRSSVVFDITMHASAIIEIADGQYLLEFAEACGRDINDATQRQDGTNKAATMRKKLSEFCDDFGFSIRPGIIGQ